MKDALTITFIMFAGIFLSAAPYLPANPTTQAMLAAVAKKRVATSPTPELRWYQLNENTGTTLGDSSAVNSSATLSNALAWATGKAGYGLNHAETYYASTAATVAYGSTSITYSFWVNRTATTATDIICESGTNYTSGDNRPVIYFDTLMRVSWRDLSEGYTTATMTLPATGTWFHYSFVLDNVTPNIIVYKDGVDQSETLDASAAADGANFATQTLYIGQRSGGTLLLNSLLDDIRIYNRAITAQEASDIFNDPR